MQPTRIVFVCLGNICRSPTAEAVFQKKVADRGWEDRFVIDSRGTSGEHAGELADPRSRAMASRFGVAITHRATKFTVDDFDRFDHILAMDQSNRRNLLALVRHDEDRAKVKLFREFDPNRDSLDVPDPWYTGEFEKVFRICETSSEAFLTWLAAP